MKKTIHIILALCAAVSCAREFQPSPEGPTVNAVAESSTKAYIDNSLNVLWAAGDEISVFLGSGTNKQYRLSSEPGRNTASFDAVPGAGITAGTELPVNAAFYPYDKDVACSVDASGQAVFDVTVPQVQAYAPGTCASGANMMAAVTSGTASTDFNFRNVLSAVQLNLTGPAVVSKIVFMSTKGRALSGKARVKASCDGVPSLEFVSDTSGMVVLDCGEGVQLSDVPTPFVIMIPAGVLDGYAVRIICRDGSVMEKESANSVAFRRACFQPFNAMRYEVSAGSDLVRIPVEQAENWNEDLSEAFFGVPAPEEGLGLEFINDPNSSFVKLAADDSHLLFKDKFGNEVEDKLSVEYVFSRRIEDVRQVGDIPVRFSVADATTLKATIGTVTETIASIADGGAGSVTLNSDSDIAKTLLNTGELRVFLGAEGYLDGRRDYPVDVRFGESGTDCFTVLYEIPCKPAETAPCVFVDGVDYGEAGSYLRIEDIAAPTDWRGRYFLDFDYYWSYYGPFKFIADFENATCNLNGEAGSYLPMTLELAQTTVAQPGWPESRFGYITYRNNGLMLTKDFQIILPMKMKHGFGWMTRDIRINVTRTIGG